MTDGLDELRVEEGNAPRDPEEVEATAGAASADISPQTRVGSVHLTVADLERSIGYYRQAIGLRVLEQSRGRARLGVEGRELLVLVEEAAAKPSHGYTGLYHFALLLPERRDLARWLDHAARDRVPLVGASDHFVSEALYLSDPDEHGIEIYWDRPREVWEGQVAARMTTLPLDIDRLLGELDSAPEPFRELPPGTVMGHVHLKVRAVPETIAFYRDRLGLALMAELGAQAAFFAAGGYHHHLGTNTWESAGAAPAPPGSAALRHATLVLPDTQERDRLLARLAESGDATEESVDGVFVRDPSGITLELSVA
ncbi:MAG TPA: VOC family protein [Gaiellaceae bacterium]|nr:VOC family protein [Gaiellaceae bacterium]